MQVDCSLLDRKWDLGILNCGQVAVLKGFDAILQFVPVVFRVQSSLFQVFVFVGQVPVLVIIAVLLSEKSIDCLSFVIQNHAFDKASVPLNVVLN